MPIQTGFMPGHDYKRYGEMDPEEPHKRKLFKILAYIATGETQQ